MHPPKPMTCRDKDCHECYWDLVGEMKVFRQQGVSWDVFFDFLVAEGIAGKMKWVDGNIYMHRSLPASALKEWGRYMWYIDMRGEQRGDESGTTD